MIPYGRQNMHPDDIKAVTDILQSDFLTTGPEVGHFESDFQNITNAKYATAFSSGTAALHGALSTLNLQENDEVILPSLTFVATANAIRYNNAKPVFADIKYETGLLDPTSVKDKITEKTRAIITVDYAGAASYYEELRALCDLHNLTLISDACHALGTKHNNIPAGDIADLTCFSFHPLKAITTGEGGMVTTHNQHWDNSLKKFRSHGIDKTHNDRKTERSFHYDMVQEGYNYRMTDFQAALGRSQLKRLDSFVTKRRNIAQRYLDELKNLPLSFLKSPKNSFHSYHLFVIQTKQRDALFQYLQNNQIGCAVHYPPIHKHRFYESYSTISLPQTKRFYETSLSLPIFPDLTNDQHDKVIDTIHQFFKECAS